jgi:hypothetical protein
MTTEADWKVKGDLDKLPFDDDELLPGGPVIAAAQAAADAGGGPVEVMEAAMAAEPEKKPRKPRAKKSEGEPVPTALSGDVLPPEIEAEEKGLIRVESSRADHHIVTGMAALARMTDSEFESTMLSIEQGQNRMREFQKRAMVEGEDYGKVKGIERPFLHLPGAEKLCLLYGLAARQEAEVIIGQQVTAMDQETGAFIERWISPPIAYHVKTYMHLGNFDGPVVAMGYGEANSWEIKYRYAFAKPSCPSCGHDLRRGGKDGKMAGKWFCPGFAGGCWWSAEITATNPDGTLVVPTPGKIENPDPHSLRETLIQMAAKRSLVASTRRATGTSGLFTQDEDSPSVAAQSDDAPDEAPPPEVEAVAPTQKVERGGKVEKPSQAQINRLGQLSREKDLGPVNVAVYLNRVTGIPVKFEDGMTREQQSAVLVAALQTATADQVGALIQTIETGEVPEKNPAEATPGEPPQDT